MEFVSLAFQVSEEGMDAFDFRSICTRPPRARHFTRPPRACRDRLFFPRDGPFSRAFPQESPFLGCQLFIWFGDVPTVALKAEQHLPLPPFCRWLSPGFDRTGREALGLVRDDQVFVVPKVIAESLAGRARAERMVERKKGGLRHLEEAPTGLTAVVLSEPTETL